MMAGLPRSLFRRRSTSCASTEEKRQEQTNAERGNLLNFLIDLGYEVSFDWRGALTATKTDETPLEDYLG